MVKWLITRFGQDSAVNSLFFAVQQSGREAEVLSLAQMYELTEKPIGEKQNIIVTGPCLVTRSAYENRKDWCPGSWHNRDLFKCSTYYAFWGKYLTQTNYLMLPLAEVIRKKDWIYDLLGKDGHIFLRPDWGEKHFNGELVCRERFDEWGRIAIEYSGATQNTITIASSPVKIDKELRLIVHNGKVVTGSIYKAYGHLIQEPLKEQEDKDAIIEFAEMVIRDNPPPLPPVFCFDIAKTDDKFSLMEVGCVTAAGFYKCDLNKIVQAMSCAAEDEYQNGSVLEKWKSQN